MKIFTLLKRSLLVLLLFNCSSGVQAGQFFDLAVESCLIKSSKSDVLEADKCLIFLQKLKNGECSTVNRKGHKSVSKNGFTFYKSKTSVLRNENTMLVCDLGDGVYASWSAGGKGSDKKPFFVPSVAKVVYIESAKPIYFSDVVDQYNPYGLPGYYLPSCNNSSMFVNGVVPADYGDVSSSGGADLH